VLQGRTHATTDDIRAVAHPVLRHRVITNFSAESSGVTSDHVIDRLLESLPDRNAGDEVAPELAHAFA
jgi:MoxR-like ATPase